MITGACVSMSLPPAEIRQFRTSDAEACSGIIRKCIKTDASTAPALRENLIRLESPESMWERSRLFYVVVYLSGGRPAGVAGIDWNEIRLLFVDPPLQRNGIGGALLHHLESTVPSGLFSDIFVYAMPGAAEFYHSHGYRAKGEHVFRVAGQNLATVFMAKRI